MALYDCDESEMESPAPESISAVGSGSLLILSFNRLFVNPRVLPLTMVSSYGQTSSTLVRETSQVTRHRVDFGSQLMDSMIWHCVCDNE